METYGALIDHVLSLVESSLHRPLSLEDVSKATHLSQYHLHRVVRELSGAPLIDYLRRLRLSASLVDLLETKRRVIDIAQDYCFEYEQSYIRAFKRLFGISPGEYRRSRPELPIADSIACRDYSFLGENGILIRPRTVMRPAVTVWGLRSAVDLEDNESHSIVAKIAGGVWERYAAGSGAPFESNPYLGIVQYSGDPRFNYYVAGFESVPEPERIPPEFSRFELPSCRCAAFSWISRCHPRRLAYSDIAEFYSRIFEDFLPSAPYAFPFPWHLESVDHAACAEDYGEFRVLVPFERSPSG